MSIANEKLTLVKEKKGKAANTGLINDSDLKRPTIKVLYTIICICLAALVFVCFAPPIWVMLSALKDSKEFFSVPATIIPQTWHPEKLWNTWNMLDFGKYYVNTLIVVAGSITVSVVFNGLLGYVLSRLKPAGSKVIMTMVLWTMMLPSSMSMVPLFKNFLSIPILGINVTESYIPMWILAGANAFYVLVFKSFFDGIPISLIEAARLDGCNNLSIFMRIMLPLSKAVIMVIMIFTINSTWSDFFWPYLVLGAKTEMYTVMVKMFYMQGGAAYSQDIQVVALTFTIIPPAILFLFFQRYIMSGFTLSGIKG